MKSVLRQLSLWAIALLALSTTSLQALAQHGICSHLTGASCIKPITISDRWDDTTSILGFAGELGRPDWRNNGQWDQEELSDPNGDGLYDEGESFVDENENGVHDQELYDPWLTGYTADGGASHRIAPGGDLGLEIVLVPTQEDSPLSAGLYRAHNLPPVNQGRPDGAASAYVFNWHNCNGSAVGPGDWLQARPVSVGVTNQQMRNWIAHDPNAHWDNGTRTVQGSNYAISPRVWIITAWDPRLLSTANDLLVRKAIAFFAETSLSPAQVSGRFLQVNLAGFGGFFSGESGGGFLVDCPVPATPSSWGRVKAAYR